MEDNITAIVTDDRVDEVLHLKATNEELLLILNYILMDYKKNSMTDKLMLQSEKMQKLTVEESLSNRYVFLFLPGQKNSMDSKTQKEVRFTYEPKDQKVLVEKYRNGRKTESSDVSYEQMKKMIA